MQSPFGPDLITKAHAQAELEQLLRAKGQRLILQKEDSFLMPGSEMTGIYYIEQGRTSHYMLDSEGGVKLLYSLSKGWFFGESSFFLNKRTDLHSRAEETTHLIRLGAPLCQSLIEDSPLFRQVLYECLSKKLLIMRYELSNLTFKPCKLRLEKLLYSLVDSSKEPIPGYHPLRLKLTHHALGDIVGGTRVTITRSLHELCSEGICRLYKNQILVQKKTKP